MFAFRQEYTELDHSTRLQLEARNLNRRFLNLTFKLIKISRRWWKIDHRLIWELEKLLLKEYPLLFIKDGDFDHNKDTKRVLINFISDLAGKQDEFTARYAANLINNIYTILDIEDIILDVTKRPNKTLEQLIDESKLNIKEA